MTEALPNVEFHLMIPLLREKEFYEPEPQRLIDWPAYSQVQITDIKETLRFIREKVDDAEFPARPDDRSLIRRLLQKRYYSPR